MLNSNWASELYRLAGVLLLAALLGWLLGQTGWALALAATLLHEPVTWAMLGVTVGVIFCVAGARRFAR